ncbi:MAG: YjbQ family protein [Sandaracinaceae bacterium]|nr:YjbQ family protein [Sandaracinaceae bacterium]
MLYRHKIDVPTKGRGTYDISQYVHDAVKASGVFEGVCHIFVHHTSASLIACENADDTVREDLERFFARLVPDGDKIFKHTDEGPDDMPSHVRSILTQTTLTVPVAKHRCDLGTWQGLYLWEHRHQGCTRKLTITVMGE